MTAHPPKPVLTFALLASLLGGCSTLPGPRAPIDDSLFDASTLSCTADIAGFRTAVDSTGTTLASVPALQGFPLLHSNRFLHELSRSADSQDQQSEWVSLAAELGIEARASENRNLDSPWSAAALEGLASCARRFASDADWAEERAELLRALRQSEFPDHYSNLRQNVGALALLRPFLRQRILAEHSEERQRFLATKNFRSSSFYVHEESNQSTLRDATWLREAYDGTSLALPLLTQNQLNSLFNAHAPSLIIEREHENDRIGAPFWEEDKLRIDTAKPTLYTLPSMTRFEGRNLLQLNYVFWFSERRPEALLDLYAGEIDSIIWRVTLNEDGSVLLYDSIHSCGCYHKYFMVDANLTQKSQPSSKEPANIFRIDTAGLAGGVVIEIDANTHYINGVESRSAHPELAGGEAYTLTPYAELRKLQTPRGNRSLFDERGLIVGSERLERFTLWPTGILSVGAMRQWGTHATGFIEEQHFDDATLFEGYFESQKGASE